VHNRSRTVVVEPSQGRYLCPALFQSENCTIGYAIGNNWAAFNNPAYPYFLLILAAVWGLLALIASSAFVNLSLKKGVPRPNVAISAWLCLALAAGSRAASHAVIVMGQQASGVTVACVEVRKDH
jgi:hypothetical protein